MKHIKTESVKFSNQSHFCSSSGCRLTQLIRSLWIREKERLERTECCVPVRPGFTRLWTGGSSAWARLGAALSLERGGSAGAGSKKPSQSRLLLRPAPVKEPNALICCRGLCRPSARPDRMSIYFTTKQQNGKHKWVMLLAPSLMASNSRPKQPVNTKYL